jgi:hypothetical protein
MTQPNGTARPTLLPTQPRINANREEHSTKRAVIPHRRSTPPPSPSRGLGGRYAAFEQVAMLDAAGTVLRQLGSDIEFSGKAAYATRMATLIGEALALGPMVALECRAGERSTFAYRDTQGGLVAMALLPGLDCSELRQRLWL